MGIVRMVFWMLFLGSLIRVEADSDHTHHVHSHAGHSHSEVEVEGPSVLDYIGEEDEGGMAEAMGYYSHSNVDVDDKTRFHGTTDMGEGAFEEGFFVFFYDIEPKYEDLKKRLSRLFLLGALLLILFSIPHFRRGGHVSSH